jgi:signal transduction histidine kinase
MDVKEELYRKNAELVNVNSTLELMHDLDEVMIESRTVEEVAGRCLDKICAKLGFVDGVVAVADDSGEHLKFIGKTHGESSQVVFGNMLSEVFVSRQEKIDKGIDERFRMVYPILLGEGCLGSFGVITPVTVETFTGFQKMTLSRLATVFGLAIDRVRTSQRLREAQERELKRILELDRMKDEFISIASHELKSPAGVVKNYLWAVINGKTQLGEAVLADLKKAYQANMRLVNLVNDLLDVSRIEGGGIEVVPGKFDLITLAGEIIGEYSPKAVDKLVQLKGNFLTTPIIVYADKNKCHQVLANLVDNAIKFTPMAGSVVVKAEKMDDKAWIQVTDTGIGVAAGDIPKLFQKFGRIDTVESAVGRTQGTGLGLYVCKKLVELSGGEMMLNSVLGKGTTVKFSLPLDS